MIGKAMTKAMVPPLDRRARITASAIMLAIAALLLGALALVPV